MPEHVPHGQHCALRRAERVAHAVAHLEAILDRRASLDLDRLRPRNPRLPIVEALRIVRAKLAQAEGGRG